MGKIHTREAILAGFNAKRAPGEAIDIPGVGEDSAALEADAVVVDVFEFTECRFTEFASELQGIERAVAGSSGDEAHDVCAGVEGGVNGLLEPMLLFLFRDEGDADEEESSDGDLFSAEKFRGVCEVGNSDALIELFEGERMAGFKAHGDFELATEHFGEFEDAAADEPGVAFEDKMLERTAKAGDVVPI